ncbi:hypothetical protein BDB01DRAFT_119124 [Pilobolus umbonatus]|nr:hypothetical protein BDB01DRAFT_119124 [Pilobolus umbonatus]
MGLTEIPEELCELQYVTVLTNDVIRPASLQLYLYGNQIESLNTTLLRLKCLTVLSLRNNSLISIPPEIALLENLVELSLGNNRLKIIPAELLRLSKLKTLSLFPNPFISPPSSTNIYRQRRSEHHPISLFEISARHVLALKAISLNHMTSVPDRILDQFNTLSHTNHCENCGILFLQPTIEELVWISILHCEIVPVNYRFCSIKCCETYPMIEQLSKTTLHDD